MFEVLSLSLIGPPKFNSSPLKSYVEGKDRLEKAPPFFRYIYIYNILNFGGVKLIGNVPNKYNFFFQVHVGSMIKGHPSQGFSHHFPFEKTSITGCFWFP